MLLHQKLIHPDINAIVGAAGHSSKILIADGNYPASSASGPRAELISLNLMPGVVTCAQVLEALLSAVPIETVNTMGIPPDDPFADHGPPEAWGEYEKLLAAVGLDLKLEPIPRWDFYEAVRSEDHVLTIQTADQALWANVLLTVGVRTPDK